MFSCLRGANLHLNTQEPRYCIEIIDDMRNGACGGEGLILIRREEYDSSNSPVHGRSAENQETLDNRGMRLFP